MKKSPIPSVVIELFEYNKDTGVLIWKKRVSRNLLTRVGKPAGYQTR